MTALLVDVSHQENPSSSNPSSTPPLFVYLKKMKEAYENHPHFERLPALREAILSSPSCPINSTSSAPPHIPIDTPEFLLRFLACAKGDVDKSAKRHNQYWRVRAELFHDGHLEFDVDACERILAARPFIVVGTSLHLAPHTVNNNLAAAAAAAAATRHCFKGASHHQRLDRV